MMMVQRLSERERIEPEADALTLPAWVGTLFPSCPLQEWAIDGSRATLRVIEGTSYLLASVCIRDAIELPAEEFERQTADAYRRIFASFSNRSARHLVRLWNFIPGLHADMGNGLDRYMVFNSGRFAAYEAWTGGPTTFDRLVATATGVGHDGRDLVIHALAADRPGIHVNNPRQARPYHYSSRYGPRPPCFARATVLTGTNGDAPVILVGGTASVRGECSVHEGELTKQADETFDNLSCLIAASYEQLRACGYDVADSPPELAHVFRDLRVYVLHAHDLERVSSLVRQRFSEISDIEMTRSDICRPELLLEIEGTAPLQAR